MPALAKYFGIACDAACDFAAAGEHARAVGGPKVREQITVPRLEYLYEIAFLRMFLAWEAFLEDSFVRYMCGFCNGTGSPQACAAGKGYHSTIVAARVALYGPRQYLLWHSTNKVVQRAQIFFTSSLHETVIVSNQARVDWFSAVRHRIAHGQDDAQKKFDAATMHLVGRRYPGSRVGKFLRDLDPSYPTPTLWIRSIGDELAALALQVVPP